MLNSLGAERRPKGTDRYQYRVGHSISSLACIGWLDAPGGVKRHS